MAALVSVAYAKLFWLAENLFHATTQRFALSAYVISPLAFLLAWLLVKRYAPEAAGSGIPQIMAANEIDYNGQGKALVDRLLSLKTALIKIASSLLCAVGGGAIGREGPTLQISTSIFHFVGNKVRRFAPGTSEHTWVVAGAASGLASAFNTPLGGIVYAIEELGLVHFHKIRTALISGVIVSGLVAQWLLGSYLFLGFPALKPVAFSILPVAVLNGAIAGALGATFGKILFALASQRMLLKKTSHLAFVAVFCGLIVAALAHINSKASGTGVDIITGLLFKGEAAEPALIVIRYAGTLVAYLSGAAGGIFSPSLALGATIGSYLAEFVGSNHRNLIVLLGMIGFLTGVTRTPFTSFILVLEMTDRHSAIFPMMLSALVAHWASHLIDKRSFYDRVKEIYTQTVRQT